MRAAADFTADEDERLRRLAQDVLGELSELDDSHIRELMGVFVSELFACAAERERREVRRGKQAEGIAAAKARGVRFGPEPKPLPDNFDECRLAWQEGRMTAVQAALECGMSKKSFYRAAVRKKTAECAV